MVEHEAMKGRSNLTHREWAPVKGGESLRQNIPQRTFQDLIQHEYLNELYRLYIVSENDTIFYVGKANNPISRILERLDPTQAKTKNERFAKFLRRYILENLFTWKFQLLTLKDCESFVVETILEREYEAGTNKSEVVEKYTLNGTWAMMQAERALIWSCRPCLNEQHNPFPVLLPAKYSGFSVQYRGIKSVRSR
jgi:hypothetical protein